MPTTMKTVATFYLNSPPRPTGSLVADAAGNLYGTTQDGGAYGLGSVFMIAKTPTGYASAPTTLVSFNGDNGSIPEMGLTIDANGNLLGTTASGGPDGHGTVFEIVKSGGVYQSTPLTLASFGTVPPPQSGLIADSHGNLFGTTASGGDFGFGYIYEIALVGTTYAAPVILAAFDGTTGTGASGSLAIDSLGNLFGTTRAGGAADAGTIFELVNNGGSYANAPVTLASFSGTDGSAPQGVVIDTQGNLFGTTSGGGSSQSGTVFELARNGSSYVGTPTTLVSFTGADGSTPLGSLTIDSAGNLYGTTSSGGLSGYGTVFEVANTGGTYAGSPTTLLDFTDANGANPSFGNVFIDAQNNILGTAPNGGSHGDGTVFQISNTSSISTISFDIYSNIGAAPQYGALISDAAGNLYGTTSGGGAFGRGSVFEIVNTGATFGSTPITIASFDSSAGATPLSGLYMDAAGNLYGTTSSGGPSDLGTVFEIVNTAGTYSSTPLTLASFSGFDGSAPQSSLIADSQGNLFGTTRDGGAGYGTVFEIVNTGSGYSSSPVTLASFTSDNGESPIGSLVMDAAGNLFGTTQFGGSTGDGTVFEIVNAGSGYAGAPVTLFDFDGAKGSNPSGGLIMDAAGNLYGTTQFGGASGGGTVFEIAKTGTNSYATTPLILAAFDPGALEGSSPLGSLIMDAVGNLFGTTRDGGANGYGTVFEITKSGGSYNSDPVTLYDFDQTDGEQPWGSLFADANGNLFGTTQGGGAYGGDGTVFEISGAYVVASGGAATVNITIDNTDLTLAHNTATVTFAFSAAPIDFNLSHVTAIGGTLSGLSGNGTTYTALFTAAPSIEITNAAVVVDSAWHTASGAGIGGTSVNFAVDTLLPTVTIALVNDTGSSASDNITADDRLAGNGTPNATVELRVDGGSPTSLATNASGDWTYTPAALSAGNHTVVVSQTDLKGNTGSSTLSFRYDPIAPSRVSASPATARVRVLENNGGALRGNTAVATFTQEGGSNLDQYTYALTGGSGRFSMSPNGILSTAVGGVTGSTRGTVYALGVQVTDTTNGLASGVKPLDVVVGSSSSDTINLTSGRRNLGILPSTPTFIYGQGGADTINASDMTAALSITGGAGADRMTGGSGADTYVYGATSESTSNNFDVITNFSTGLDRIDLTGIGSSSLAFRTSPLTGNTVAAHTIAWQQRGGNTFVYVNTSNANESLGNANMVIELNGRMNLTSGNILHT